MSLADSSRGTTTPSSQNYERYPSNGRIQLPSNSNSPDHVSLALSNSDTLFMEKKPHLELQDTYVDNYTSYLPFIWRQLRDQKKEKARRDNNRASLVIPRSIRIDEPERSEYRDADFEAAGSVDAGSFDFGESNYVYHDISDSSLENESRERIIMGKDASRYSVKRRFVLVTDYVKRDTYLFTDDESFTIFKDLRAARKQKKGSRNNEAQNLAIQEWKENPSQIIPISFKKKGMGLPLFKIKTPHSLKKNAPFIVFKRYREVPLMSSNIGDDFNGLLEPEFETYDFCTVWTRQFSTFKRITFSFSTDDGLAFKVLAFQDIQKPLTDFKYKGTRFRFLGVPERNSSQVARGLKLMVIDDDKPSLCDSIINKKQGFELSSFLKRRKGVEKSNENGSNFESSYNKGDPTTYPNPVPHPSNVLLSNKSSRSLEALVSRKSPPFGDCVETLDHFHSSRKYAETGRVELYQDISTLNSANFSSTLSTDIDSLVLTCITLTLKEMSARDPNNSSVTSSGLGKIGALTVQPIHYAPMLT